jgi:hypothetical protein
VTRTANEPAAPPIAEAMANPIRPAMKHRLAAEHVTQPSADQQQAAERQRDVHDRPV